MGYSCAQYTKLAEKDDIGNTNIKSDSDQCHSRWIWWWHVTKLVVCSLLVLTTIVGLCGYMWTRHQVIRFTERIDEPDMLPVSQMSEADLNVVKDRVKLFGDTILAGQVPDHDLILTPEEINGFIAHSEYLRGHAYVRIGRDETNVNDDGASEKLWIDMTLPAKSLPGGRNRYFVASGFMDIATTTTTTTTTTPNLARITTFLDTKHKVRGVDGPIWHAEMSITRDDEENNNHLVLLLEEGNFLNWVAPPNFIDEKQNLLDYILYDCHHHHHHEDHHHHHHHGDHHHDDHHHHHDKDHHHHHDKDHHHQSDQKDVQKIAEAIQSVAFQDGRIVVRAGSPPLGA